MFCNNIVKLINKSIKFYDYIFVFLFLFIAMMVFLVFRHTVDVADDLSFKLIANSESDYFSWLVYRYNNWSSRIPIEFALINLIKHFYIWSIFNSLFFAIVCLSVVKLSCCYKGSKKWVCYSSAFIFVVILCTMPKTVIFSSIVWMTGSFNYLWPISLCLAGLLCFKKYLETKRNVFLIIVIVNVFLSSFAEQVAIFNTLFFTGVVFINAIFKRRINILLVSPLVCSIFVVIIIALSPGNNIRYQAEVLRSFVGYNEINFWGKLVMGVNLFADQMTMKKTLLTTLFMGSYLLLIENKKIKKILFFSFLFSIVESVKAFLFNGGSVYYVNIENVFSYFVFFRVVFVFVFFISPFFMLFLFYIKKKKLGLEVILVGAYLSSTISTIIIGFSPTIYASEDRVFFVSYLVMAAVSTVNFVFYLDRKVNQR